MGEKISGSLRLYLRYLAVIVKSTMQYKASFWLGMIGQFLVSFNGLLGIAFIFARFPNIKGYTYPQALLCYSIMLFGGSLAECFARGFDAFSWVIKKGEFDRMLVRPRSLFLQVLGSRFEINRTGRVLQAAAMLWYGILHCAIPWTAGRVVTLLSMVFGVILLFSGLFLTGAAICFFTIEDAGLLNILIYGGMEHGKYPIDIYGRRMLRFCTYIIPYALVQYYPLQYLLGRTSRWEYGLYPFGVLVFVGIAYCFWRFGMRHYQSTGS